jgi:exopolysaccharide production protein ExoQ
LSSDTKRIEVGSIESREKEDEEKVVSTRGAIATAQPDNLLEIFISALSIALCLPVLVVISLEPIDDLARLFIASLLLMLGLVMAFRTGKDLNVGLVLWLFLLVSKALFVRTNDPEDTVSGTFSLSAYFEVIFWIEILLFLFIYSLLRPRYLRMLFERRFKVLTLFVALTIMSAAYSFSPLFSLSWSLKLGLIALALYVLATYIQSFEHIQLFLKVTCFGLLFFSLSPLVHGFSEDVTLFTRGRWGGMIAHTTISTTGGALLLLSVISYMSNGRRWMLVLSGVGLTVMLLGLGKSSIISASIAVTLFLLMRKKIKAVVLYWTGFALIAMVISILFPETVGYLGDYVDAERYQTLTGRTYLWRSAVDAIASRPILGHGYMASKFFTNTASVSYWQPTHMHNVFVEVLYNNGIVGLFLLLALNGILIKNLVAFFKEHRKGRFASLMFGITSAYIYLIILSFVRPAFGGRPTHEFMIFISLLVLTNVIRRLSENETTYRHGALVPGDS